MVAFRTFLVALFSLVMVALGASLSHHLTGGAVTLATGLPVVAWLAFEARLVPGAAAAAAVGLVADLAAGGPMGLLTFLSVMAFLGVRAASGAVGARGRLAMAVLTGVAALVVGFLALLLLRYVSPPDAAPRWGLMGRVVLEALGTAAVAPPVAWLLDRTVGAPPAEEAGLL
jgi:hypothetical protein